MSENLRAIAERTDAAVARARAELVAAVRRAYADGMTQAEIAQQIGRSQPEVNRLLRFHGSSPRAKALRHHSPHVRERIRAAGGGRVRVFGSTATGTDGADSDIDLLFDMRQPLSLMEMSTIERELSSMLGYAVDLVPESSVRPDLRDQILREAIPL
jgi:predicted nucleotidyltransferase